MSILLSSMYWFISVWHLEAFRHYNGQYRNIYYLYSLLWPLYLIGQVIYWIGWDSEDNYWELNDE